MKTDYTLESLRPLSVGVVAAPNPAAVGQPVTFNDPLWIDLVAYWNLNEASGTRRDARGEIHLLEVGATGSVAGKGGNAASFDPAGNHYLQSVKQADISGVNGITFTCWLQIRTGAPTIAAWFKNGAAFVSYMLLNTTNSNPNMVSMTIYDDLGGGAGIGILVAAYDTWYFVTAIYDPATMKVSISIDNGAFTVSAATLSTHPTINDGYGAGHVEVGGTERGGVRSKSYIDEIGLWSRVLTADEITALYAAGAGKFYSYLGANGDIPPYTYRWQFEQGLLGNGLIHSWALDESPSGTRHDSKGTCDLTEVGNVPAVAGLVGNAADMTSGYLWGPALTEALTQKFTFAITFKAPVTDGSYWGLFYIANAFSIGLIQNRVYAEVVAWTDPHASWGPVSADGLWHTVILWVDRDEDNRIQSSLDGAATVYSALPITGTFNVDPGLGSSVYVGNVGENTGVPTGLVVQRLLWWNRSLTAEERATVLTYQSGEESPVHTYSTPGTKVASLTVTSAHGCVATRTVAVVVS